MTRSPQPNPPYRYDSSFITHHSSVPMFPLYDNNPIQRTPVVTYALMAINVLVFFWMSRLPEVQQQVLAYQHGFVPKRISQLDQPHPIFVPVEVTVQIPFWGARRQQRMVGLDPVPGQIWLSLLTCMFLHGSWMHVLLNMWFLWLFGDNVEDRLGPLLYLVLYLLGGLIASGAHWMVEPDSTMPVIGARGHRRRTRGLRRHLALGAGEHLGLPLGFRNDHRRPRTCGVGAWFVLQYGPARSRYAKPRGAAWPGGARRRLGRHGADALSQRHGRQTTEGRRGHNRKLAEPLSRHSQLRTPPHFSTSLHNRDKPLCAPGNSTGSHPRGFQTKSAAVAMYAIASVSDKVPVFKWTPSKSR